MIKALKYLCAAIVLVFYIAFALPLTLIVAARFFIFSISKTWQKLVEKLIGPRKKSETKKLEEQHAELLQQILKKEVAEIIERMIREAAAKAANEEVVDWNKVAVLGPKGGNC